jgi:trbC/VIRB2 family
MKKSIKVISTLLLAIMLVASIAGTVLAVDPNTVLNGLNGNGNVQINDLTKVGNNIVTIIQVVGIVIAVIVLLVIGIKYMMGSASEKAEYKKTMIPYIVGAVLIFAGTSLVRVIYSLSTSVSTK